VASLRRCQKLAICPIETMLAGFMKGSPLAEAEPVSDSGSAFVIIYLRR